ncbi:MAG: ligase-associated DNA damage response endonuclease PdeM [Geminicoccaceae bacterium]
MNHFTPLKLGRETLLLDASGAVFWPSQSTLLVADLHLEKASAFARQGQLLPPYDTRSTLDKLARTVLAFRPERVISLGDGLHHPSGWGTLDAADRRQLDALAQVCTWQWLAGNHDPDPPQSHGCFVGDHLTLGALDLRHHPSRQIERAEIAGHLHPRACLRFRGRRIARRCFATDGRRLIMPAFGAFAGGLDVLEPVFQSLFQGAFTAFFTGRRGPPRAIPSNRLEPSARAASSE